MRRRDFCQVVGAGCAASVLAPKCWGQTKDKPNIVFILGDDMGYHQLAANGYPFYETPHLDQLASEGMRFTTAYAAAPICSPTRASIMTGKSPARLHITDYIPGNPFPYNKLKTPQMNMGLPLEEMTLAEMLKNQGYVCGHFGKWHLNKDKDYRPGRPGDPASQGFDEVLTTEKPDEEETAKAGADPEYDAHHVKEITDRSIAFMEKNKEKPFFCYVTHNSIHRPVMEYAPEIVEYAIKPEAGNKMGNNPVIGAMVERLDKNIGRLLGKIDELGLRENTLVVFLGDNGDLYGREGLKPHYGAKADLYEGGVRVPMLVRWPGQVEAGSVCGEMVTSDDFFPTLAEVTRYSVDDPEIDGISLLPALLQRSELGRDTLCWHYPHYHHLGVAPAGTIREGNYKLIEWFEKSILEGPDAEGALQLFDLEKDPGERCDLSGQMPDKTKELYGKLIAWRKKVGAQEMVPNPGYERAREGWRQADEM
jgi:arylsulfatase A-like enzyme